MCQMDYGYMCIGTVRQSYISYPNVDSIYYNINCLQNFAFAIKP